MLPSSSNDSVVKAGWLFMGTLAEVIPYRLKHPAEAGASEKPPGFQPGEYVTEFHFMPQRWGLGSCLGTSRKRDVKACTLRVFRLKEIAPLAWKD